MNFFCLCKICVTTNPELRTLQNDYKSKVSACSTIPTIYSHCLSKCDGDADIKVYSKANLSWRGKNKI